VLSFVEVIAEDADIAIKTLLEVKWDVDETNNNSFLKIATKLEKRKDFTGAAKRFRQISPTTPTINAELLDQTKETLSSGERLKDSQTAKELMKHGYKQQRTATLGKLQLIANRITDPSLKAKIQVNIGDIRGAISTANQVKNTKYQYPLVLAQIAKALLGKPFYEKLPEGVDLLLK
jgi:NAD+--asparagine ADP-ribosyltransferase